MAAPPNKTLQDLNGNWTLNAKLSDDPVPALELQGVNYFIRKAASFATGHLKVTQPDKDHVTMNHYTMAMKITGTNEEYTLDWEWRERKDPVFGKLKTRSRWISVEDAMREGARGDWIAGDSDGMLVQAQGDRVDDSWGGIHFWGFEEVDGARMHVRRSVIKTKTGEELHMRMVYDFDSE